MVSFNYLPAIDRIVLTPKGEYHQDPEILQKDPKNGKARIIFLDGRTREAWVADLNPKNGEWLNNNKGKDYLVAADVAPMNIAQKACHFGLSNGQNGSKWKIYYSKTIGGLTSGIFVSEPNFNLNGDPISDSYTEKQITSYSKPRLNPLASQSFEMPDTRILFAGGGNYISYVKDSEAYFDTETNANVYAPDYRLTPTKNNENGFRWIKDSKYALSTLLAVQSRNYGQIQMTDSDQMRPRAKSEVLTYDDLGLKFDPQGWYDPARFGDTNIYQNDLVLLGITHNKTKMTVYSPPLVGETKEWKIEKTIDPSTNPNILSGETTKIFQTPEPWFYKGKSYLVATVKNYDAGVSDTLVTKTEIWLWNISDYIDEQTTPPILISDDPENYKATEAEFFEAEDQLMLYFVKFKKDVPYLRFEIVLARNIEFPGE